MERVAVTPSQIFVQSRSALAGACARLNSAVAAMGFEWIQKPLGWRERYWKLLELRMRAVWRSMTWTIGFLMGTRNLADWWQVLIGLERTSQQQKRPVL